MSKTIIWWVKTFVNKKGFVCLVVMVRCALNLDNPDYKAVTNLKTCAFKLFNEPVQNCIAFEPDYEGELGVVLSKTCKDVTYL